MKNKAITVLELDRNKILKNQIIIMKIILMLALSSIAINSFAQTIEMRNNEYLEKQNSYLSNRIEFIFDNNHPEYQSEERMNALFLVDGITHYPKPHGNAIKKFFFNRYKKTLKSIKDVKVDSGVVIWNVYNMGYIVKTPKSTIAFDLIVLPDCMIKEGDIKLHKKILSELVAECDILFVSHNHGDHKDIYVAKQFLSQNKPVIAQKGIFTNEDYYNRIEHPKCDGNKIPFIIPDTKEKLILRIYPGHQAVAADRAIDNNFTLITLSNNITIAHSGDQSWNADFKWLDTMSKDIDIDILMVNTWTANPERLTKGLKPKVILPGHVNEMDHTIRGREPYWKSYKTWKDIDSEIIHLFWGEPFIYGK